MAKEMTTRVADGGALVITTPVAAGKTVASIAAMLPPKLSEDMPLKAWLHATVTTIGQHPQSVLDDARDAILSTKTFAPAPSEIIDAILAAYKRLGVPLSEDALRHLAFRKKTSHRYALDETGRQRFAPDAKVTTIGFVGVSGVHANMLLDESSEASVADVETAIVQAAARLKAEDKVTIATILDVARDRLDVVIAYRKFGPPDALCGGAVAIVKGYDKPWHARSDYFALSHDFVESMRRKYPYAKSPWGRTWTNAMHDAFTAGMAAVNVANYGQPEAQKAAEAMVDGWMADANRAGVDDQHRTLGASLRLATRALEILDNASWSDPRPLRIQLAERTFLVHGADEVATARATIVAEKTEIEKAQSVLAPFLTKDGV